AQLFWPTVAVTATAALRSVVRSLLGAVGYPSYQSWLASGEFAVRLVAVVALAAVVDSAAELLLVTVAVRLLVELPTLAVVDVVASAPGRTELRRAWSFSRWSVVDQLVDKVSYNMPVYVLGVVATPAAVSVYEAADRFADFGATIAFGLSSPLLTRVSGDWSAGADTYDYLDAMVTGGTGGTFLVFAYLLGNAAELASVVFPESVAAFRVTLLLVGGVNLLRAVWTLLTHALEGVDRPQVGVTTKLIGLAVAVPVTAVLGGRGVVGSAVSGAVGGAVGVAVDGAVGGAVGYVVLNLLVFVGVVWYAVGEFGRFPVEFDLAGRFAAAAAGAFGVTILTTRLLDGTLSDATVVGVTGVACLLAYVGVVAVIVPRSRPVFRRAYTLTVARIGDLRRPSSDN
ncbi:MAG: transporter, partial [Halobaculum sp.]